MMIGSRAVRGFELEIVFAYTLYTDQPNWQICSYPTMHSMIPGNVNCLYFCFECVTCSGMRVLDNYTHFQLRRHE